MRKKKTSAPNLQAGLDNFLANPVIAEASGDHFQDVKSINDQFPNVKSLSDQFPDITDIKDIGK
jgi:hypothetical protein